MDNPALDDQYLTWLYSQVASVRAKSLARTYWNLLRQMYKTEFVWFVPNDDNRVEDGRDLRHEFIEEHDLDVDPDWLGLGCSFLEMMIGISRRLAFEAEGEPRNARHWFWHLIDNLDLRHMNDAHCQMNNHCDERIAEAIDNVIWRTYSPTGYGGLFPLKNPEEDQRDVELWYQLCAYVLELNLY